MAKKILILTENQVRKITDTLIYEQQEKIYTDFDKVWDYKLDNNMWFTSKKGQNKWLSLANYPEAIKRLNNRYNPNTVTQATQNVAKTVNNVDNKIKSTVSRFPEKLRSTGDAIMDKVDKFGNKLNDAGNVISDKLNATGDVISNKVKEGVGDIKGFMRKMAPNVAQMFFTRPLTGNDFTKSQRNVIYNVIQNAIKKGKKRERGVTDYSDYGGKINEIFNTKTGASTKDIILRTATDPYFQVASTLGAFTYQLQKDGTYKIIDTYDFSKGIGYTVSKEEIKGMSFFEQMSYVMKKDNLTPYRAARQIAYIEHPDTADENDKVKISLIINPKEFSA